MFAVVVDRQNIECKVGEGIQARQNSTDPLLLYVSNDGGQRWVSGLLGALGAVRWFNNSMATPVTAFSIYKSIHVGAMITDSSHGRRVMDGLRMGAALAERDHIFGPAIKVNVHFIETKGDGATAVAATKALLAAFPNVVGIVGGHYSSTTIPVAFNISLPLRLPMIGYGASHSSLGDKKALPYFVRTCASMTNEVNELANFFDVFQWNRIGIITSYDPYCLDAGESLRDRFTAGGDKHTTTKKKGVVLYKGQFEELADGASAAEIDTAATSRGADGLATHALRLKELGVRVIFVSMLSSQSCAAVFKAFATAGFNSPGYAFISTWFPPGLPEEAEGVIALEREWPPSKNISDYASEREDAHDAMYALLRGVGAVINGGDGGAAYQSNSGETRPRAMANIRRGKIPASKMASGALSFDPNSNDRAVTDLAFKFVGTKRVQGNKLVLAPIGRLSKDKHTFESDRAIVWPGNSSALPADRDLTGIAPKVVTIAWLEKESYFDYPRFEKYLRWRIEAMNADKYLLPFTRLELRHEVLNKSTSGVAFTAACERVAREAKAEGKPVVGFLSSGTSRTKEVLKMSPPLPTVAYTSSQAIMENAAQFPWLVRMFPSDSQRAEATTQMLRNYEWTKIFMVVDEEYTWANSLAKDIADKSR